MASPNLTEKMKVRMDRVMMVMDPMISARTGQMSRQVGQFGVSSGVLCVAVDSFAFSRYNMALTGSLDEDVSLRDSDVELLSSDDEDSKALDAVVLDDFPAAIAIDADKTLVVAKPSEAGAKREASGAELSEAMCAKPSQASCPEPSQASCPEPSQASCPEPSSASCPEPSRASCPEPSRASGSKLRRSGGPRKTHEFHGAVFDVDALDATTCEKCGRRESQCKCLVMQQLQQKIVAMRSYQAARARREGFKNTYIYNTLLLWLDVPTHCMCLCVQVTFRTW